MNRLLDLNENQRSTITHALYVAAERFDEHVKTCSSLGQVRMREQFEGQARETRELAERIEAADYVRLGPVVEE